MDHIAILVPLKRFDVAKVRLRKSGVVNVSDVARQLAIGVLTASHPRDVIVICESEEIAKFAREHSAEPFISSALDLNEAVSLAYQYVAKRYERVIIAHGDLREPAGLGSFAPEAGITIFTDHHGSGTNVLVLPTGVGFQFRYGPHSANLHLQEAQRLNMPMNVVSDSPWRFDVDVGADLK